MTTFELNGKEVTVQGDHPHLLAALRDEVGILSAKVGCSPSGQCGCCTVIMDGKARISCQLSADGQMDHSDSRGLDTEEIDKKLKRLQRVPCRILTPGIDQDKVLVDKGPELKRVRCAPFGCSFLCRCTGYVKFYAVEALAKGEIPGKHSAGLGSRLVKYEAEDLAIGRRPFIDDIQVEGLAWAFLLTSMLGPMLSIDASEAESLDEVVRLLLPLMYWRTSCGLFQGLACVYSCRW